ncbi:MAG: HD-GYP domain-containing protein, partial [archaeon]
MIHKTLKEIYNLGEINDYETRNLLNYFLSLLYIKDYKLYKHSLNVGYLSYITALSMGLKEKESKDILIGGLLHDIGKLSIPIFILIKNNILSCSEYEIIKKHSFSGYQLAKTQNNINKNILKIILQHHERVDGSGYPFKLKEKDIYIGSKIVGAVDVLTALYSKRSYKQAYPLDRSINYLKQKEDIFFSASVIYNINKLYIKDKILL